MITFLRPGLIKIKNEKEIRYYVEEGTVEFSNNILLILTSTAKDYENLKKSSINDLIEKEEKSLKDINLTDKEKYILSYKIDTLKEFN